MTELIVGFHSFAIVSTNETFVTFYAARYLQFKFSLDFNIDAFLVLSSHSRHSKQLTSDVTGVRE